MFKKGRKFSNRTENEPIITRELEEELVGISYDKYLNLQENNFNRRILEDEFNSDDKLSAFNYKLDFLFRTVIDLKTKQKEILELWKLCLDLIKEKEYTVIENFRESSDITILIFLTKEAEFSKKNLEDLDRNFTNQIRIYLFDYLKNDIDFITKIEKVIQWNSFHSYTLNYWKIGDSYDEIGVIKKIVKENIANIEALKTSSPKTYINFVETLKTKYKFCDKERFRVFYLEKCLEQIIVAKNSGYYLYYDKYLEDYYSEKYRNNKFINCAFKYLIGYGEKPSRIFLIFLFSNVIFTLLFAFGDFQFCIPITPSNNFEKLLMFASFNNTTMLTVGYGDMYPEGIGARIMVAVLQILGVIITSTAIALFLRKILRF